MSEDNAVEINETIEPEVQEIENTAQDEQSEQPAQVEQTEEQQKTELTEKMQGAMNKKHWQFKEEERRANALQKQLDDIQAANKPVEIEIPAIPDEFEDDFQEKMVIRDRALQERARQQEKDEALEYNQRLANQQIVNQQRQEAEKQSLELSQKAKSAGVDEASFNEAIGNIGRYNLGQGFANLIMKDEDSVAIIQHLSADPMELDNLSRMYPEERGARIAAIKIKAQALKPRQSNTPKPPSDIQGSGQDPDLGKYPNSQGAKFW